MLILSRLEDEAIVFSCGGQSVRVMVTEIDGNRVKLGVQAPRDVRVMREELLPAVEAAGVPFEM